VRLTGGTVGWIEDEIENWIDARIAVRDASEVTAVGMHQ
jgi:predicted DNA-binding transcriptional regulator AlpA